MLVHVYLCVCVCDVTQEVVIQQDDEIRVKIVGTRVDATDIVSDDLPYL